MKKLETIDVQDLSTVTGGKHALSAGLSNGAESITKAVGKGKPRKSFLH